jgi:hypothetical protein
MTGAVGALKSDGGSGHLAAFFGAALTGLCAALAVVMLVLFAFRAAGVTDFGADAADVAGELGTAAHIACGAPAHLGAVNVEADALRHHLHIFLAQARIRAMLAFLRAFHTRFDTRLIFQVTHFTLLFAVLGPFPPFRTLSPDTQNFEQQDWCRTRRERASRGG